jgi:riboflavin synthase
MFTGIIETLATIQNIEQNKSNVILTFSSPISHELKIDQSVAHNGVCLTVTKVFDTQHQVVAIQETLNKTNMSQWQKGDLVNIERCMPANGRFDGHIVQGHVDCTAKCINIQDENGSWVFTFGYEGDNITVEKGSICVNGTSLTVIDSSDQEFSVAIIPFTFENTVFKTLKIGDFVNLEFDIIGKYIARLLKK